MTPTQTAPQTSAEVAAALRNLATARLRRSLGHALATFAETPDDKLDYKPSETANSVRELVQHMIGGNRHVGACYGLVPSETEASDRESLAAELKASTEAIVAAIESLTPEQMDTLVPFFGMEIPMTTFIVISEWHISRHTGQIDYLQTIWGDLENHM